MKSNELLRKIKKAGWREVRQNGSHLIMEHDEFSYKISVPDHGSKEVGTGLAKTLLKQAGL